jgi:hypothetical protein
MLCDVELVAIARQLAGSIGSTTSTSVAQPPGGRRTCLPEQRLLRVTKLAQVCFVEHKPALARQTNQFLVMANQRQAVEVVDELVVSTCA